MTQLWRATGILRSGPRGYQLGREQQAKDSLALLNLPRLRKPCLPVAGGMVSKFGWRRGSGVDRVLASRVGRGAG
jgi:hypothetical protein